MLDVRRRTVLGIERGILDAGHRSRVIVVISRSCVCSYFSHSDETSRDVTSKSSFDFDALAGRVTEAPPVAPSINRTAESISCGPALFIVRATNERRASAKKAGAAARSARTSQTEQARRRADCLYVTCIVGRRTRARGKENTEGVARRSALGAARRGRRGLYAARACASRLASRVPRPVRALLHNDSFRRKHSSSAYLSFHMYV